ncbi:hypothetical protein EV361DRAFT_870538 [Lentinula raphanica]|uniref:Uncharacterized protein n=1 Tax=Lentinula raphanica TaxID=153919 RepID=A0AA38UEK7_9AGAR|nr:hypothetical protein F5880DRAFT_1616177 [Lentinula raphanica]KAJ3835172.1 hypothetical protein F5878DRAFT_693718 [Lentinula raphanica]KAJ3968830.1 hypothetical protein EV361DRAFT_870538 [Lentinula raphanica]
MSAPNATGNVDSLIAFFKSETRVSKLRRSKQHTNSTTTRRPSDYDKHIPGKLQLPKLLLGRPDYEGDPFVHYLSLVLAKNPTFLQELTPERMKDLKIHWRIFIECIDRIPVVNEEGVVDAEKYAGLIQHDMASFTSIPLSSNQLEKLGSWVAFNTYRSHEKESKADLIHGLAEQELIMDKDYNSSCSAIWPFFEGLNTEFMHYLTTVECKNLNLGHPLCYLTLLLLSCIMQRTKDLSLWPQLDCIHCDVFPNSHLVQEKQAEADIPEDRPEGSTYGLVETPFDQLKHDQNEFIYQEISHR